MRFTEDMIAEDEKCWHARDVVTELGYCSKYIKDRKNMTNLDIRFYAYIMRKAYEMLKAQEPRLITEADFKNADQYGTIPAWCEMKDDLFCECILIGALEEEGCRYWTDKPTLQQMEAIPWN